MEGKQHVWGIDYFKVVVVCMDCLVRYDSPEAEVPCDDLLNQRHGV